MWHNNTYARYCPHCHHSRHRLDICIPRPDRKRRSAPMPSLLEEKGWRWWQPIWSCARREFFLGGENGHPARSCDHVRPAPNVPRGREPPMPKGLTSSWLLGCSCRSLLFFFLDNRQTNRGLSVCSKPSQVLCVPFDRLGLTRRVAWPL